MPPAAGIPPALPSAAAKLPNKFRLLVIAGCAALALLVVIIILAFALSRSPAEQCVDTANDARSAILEGRAGDLYDLMPSSWQKDLDGQLRLLSTRIDEDTFEQTTKLAGELADLLDDKEDVVLAWLRDGARPTALANDFGFDGSTEKDVVRDLIGALRAISRWSYDDLREGRFKRLFGDRRVAALLERLIRRTMEEDEMSASEFTLVDPDQTETVTLRVSFTKRRYAGWDDASYRARYKKETSEKALDWVRFEDCWVPVDLLRPKRRNGGWSRGMNDIRESIEDMQPRDIREFRKGVSMLRAVLPRFRDCETSRDVERVLRSLD